MNKYRFMLARPVFIAFFFILISGIFYTGCIYASSESSSVKITEGLEYRIGDSPINSDGLPEWIFDNSLEWKPYEPTHSPQGIKESQYIVWIRLKLPYSIDIDSPSLYFKAPHQSLEAYIDGKLVYKSGKIDTTGKGKSYNVGLGEIPLNYSSHNKFVYIRVYSCFSEYIGILNSVEIASSRNFTINILKSNHPEIVLSFYYIFIGFMSLILFLVPNIEEKSLLPLSIFTLCLGLSSISSLQLLFYDISPTFWFYVQSLSTLFVPIGISAYLEQIFLDSNTSTFKFILWGYIFFDIISIILEITNLASFLYTINIFFLFSLATVPFTITMFIKAYKKGDTNIRIITFGIVSMCTISVYYILDEFLGFTSWSGFLLPIGLFIFTITLIIVTCRRFIAIYDKLKLYSQEIETKNTTINKINTELESTNEELLTLLDEIKNTQAQLIQSEKMATLGGLVAGVAHEINTPLGISITATSFMQRQIRDFNTIFQSGKMKKSDLEICISSLEEISILIMSNIQKTSDFVKIFKQIAVHQSSEEKRKFNVSQYIEEILLSLEPKTKDTNHTITLNCDNDIVICSYPGALSQIIANLIMNSLMHAYDKSDKGNITIDVSVKDQNLYLRYSDDGKGISSEIIHKIFDPFFTTKRGSGGTGLGLNIVYNIVRQTLSGSIFCESELERGATFIIEIPLREGIE